MDNTIRIPKESDMSKLEIIEYLKIENRSLKASLKKNSFSIGVLKSEIDEIKYDNKSLRESVREKSFAISDLRDKLDKRKKNNIKLNKQIKSQNDMIIDLNISLKSDDKKLNRDLKQLRKMMEDLRFSRDLWRRKFKFIEQTDRKYIQCDCEVNPEHKYEFIKINDNEFRIDFNYCEKCSNISRADVKLNKLQ